jgi:hypothetical protein
MTFHRTSFSHNNSLSLFTARFCAQRRRRQCFFSRQKSGHDDNNNKKEEEEEDKFVSFCMAFLRPDLIFCTLLSSCLVVVTPSD